MLFLLEASIFGDAGSDEMADSVGETHFSVVWESIESVDGDREILRQSVSSVTVVWEGHLSVRMSRQGRADPASASAM